MTLLKHSAVLNTLIAFAGLAACFNALSQPIDMPDNRLQQAGVRFESISPAAQTSNTLRVPGVFAFARTGARAVVLPEASTVLEVLQDNLNPVKAGQPVIRVMSEAWLQAQEAWVQAHTQFKLSDQQHQRDQQLHAEGLIALRRLQDSQAQHTLASAQLKKAEARLRQVGGGAVNTAALQKGNLQNSLTVTSPQTGIVSGLQWTAGERIADGQALFVVQQAQQLALHVQLSASQANEVQPGQAVSFNTCSGQNKALGQVTGVSPQLTDGQQTALVRVNLTGDPSNWRCYKVNQSVWLDIQTAAQTGPQTNTQAKGMWVPQAAVSQQGQQSVVFVKTAKGFEPITVQVLGWRADQVLVDAPQLSAQSKVAVSGLALLKGAWRGLGQEAQ